ncbi:MAG: hypothetical protein QM811_14485 [Pirellulales bacterium]
MPGFVMRAVLSLSIAWTMMCVATVRAEDFIPRRQSKPPGPPLKPEEAAAKMTVPEGFKVEIVAAEPDVVNPVAMTIDERGRFWITESFEYPRREPGPGRDRVKILEDVDGDGKADKTTIFAEGLNIPSGIAVGYGGVWVANAPDILFLQDTDGDGKADKQEVVVTGFGRDDTHELPNSLTWGPDGWLYGLNGVFNNCHVRYPKSSPHYKADHPGFPFSCAVPHSSAHARVSSLLRRHQQSLGNRDRPRRQLFRERVRHRPSVAFGRNGLLHPPRGTVSAVDLEDAVDRQAQTSNGCLLRYHLLRQRRLSRQIPRQALHGQHPRQLLEQRPRGKKRLDVQGSARG